MANRKNDESKVVVKNANGTFLDIRIVHQHTGEGKKRKVVSSDYGIFHSKNRASKEKFKSPDLALDFISTNFHKYDKKLKRFK